MLAQNPAGKSMEGMRPDQNPLPGNQGLQTAAHFTGGLIVESHGQDAAGGHAGSDQIGDAISDDAGFSGSRPGQHQKRPPAVKGPRLLFRIKSVNVEWHGEPYFIIFGPPK